MNQLALLDVNPAARRDHDFYPTPEWMTRALLKRVPIYGDVLECCAGFGAIANVLDDGSCQRRMLLNEPYQRFPLAKWRLDATKPESWQKFRSVDWVVTNPPFNLADAIVPLALRHARMGVAMLLRLSWLEPTEARGELLAKHPPAVVVLPRHDFRGNGQTDSVTSAWFLWAVNEGSHRYGRFQNDIVTKQERDRLCGRLHLEGETA